MLANINNLPQDQRCQGRNNCIGEEKKNIWLFIINTKIVYYFPSEENSLKRIFCFSVNFTYNIALMQINNLSSEPQT